MSVTVPGPPDEELGELSEPLPVDPAVRDRIAALVEQRSAELVYMRRWFHARPELSRAEHETTATLWERLKVEGLDPHVLAVGTGLVCDIGHEGPIVAIRGDMDGLALQDAKDVPYRSTREGACHGCGHDVHMAVALGAGLVLRDLIDAGLLRGRVRLIFEPSEEVQPGGALDVIEEGWIDDVTAIFGMHCDPKLDAGRLGCRIGAITSASDALHVRLTGPGGHTARPHLTVNLTDEAARLVRELPAVVQADVGDSAQTRLVFGMLHSGSAPNVIPSDAQLAGSLRTPSPDAWDLLGTVVPRAIANVLDTDLRPDARGGHQGARHDGLHWHLEHRRGIPPVVNDPVATRLVARAALDVGGSRAVSDTPHSWGGDTFGWYLHRIPGCYTRLGTHWPGHSEQMDLHQPTFDIDEDAIPFGARVMALTAVAWLSGLG